MFGARIFLTLGHLHVHADGLLAHGFRPLEAEPADGPAGSQPQVLERCPGQLLLADDVSSHEDEHRDLAGLWRAGQGVAQLGEDGRQAGGGREFRLIPSRI